MPRRKPLQNNKPSSSRRKPSDFKYEQNYDHCYSVPCTDYKCCGFMFLLAVKYGQNTPTIDELECFVCKRIRKLGTHNPNRNKPVPFVRNKQHSRKK